MPGYQCTWYALQEDEESVKAAQMADMKRRWREQQDDVVFPDEVSAETPSSPFALCKLWTQQSDSSLVCSTNMLFLLKGSHVLPVTFHEPALHAICTTEVARSQA